VPVASHRNAVQLSRPVLLDRKRHGSGGLAGGGDEGAAFRRAGQVSPEDLQWIGCCDRNLKAFFEKRPQPKLSFAASVPRL
jgi:hypothetical protein